MFLVDFLHILIHWRLVYKSSIKCPIFEDIFQNFQDCFQFFQDIFQFFQDFSNFFKCVNTISAQGPVTGPKNMLGRTLDDVIHEQGQNVSVYTNMYILWGWLILVRGEVVNEQLCNNQIVGF